MKWPLIRILPREFHIDFVRLAPFAAILSAILVLGSIGSFVAQGLNFGIDFVGGIRGTAELEKRCRSGWAVAFALHPTSLDQLMRVADAGEVMPPKSTWFEPKLRSGLTVRLLGDAP